MASCFNIPEEFTFHWKVTNFDACFLHNHESFDSPSFSLKNFYNTRWYLRLSLESHRKYGFEYVCALVREYDEGPNSVRVYCKVSCDSEIIMEGFQSFTKGSKYDFQIPELYDFDKFPQMNSLVFKCEMLLGNSDFPNYLKSNLPTVLRENLSANCMNTSKGIYTHSKQGFAFSRYSVERRIIIFPFRDFKPEKMQKILITSFTEVPTLSVEFSTVSEDDFVYLKVNFVLIQAKLKSNLLLYSEVSFVDTNLETIDSGKDYHLFRRNIADEIWSFGHFFDWSQILKANNSNNLHFSCQLFFFDGQLQSEILWTTDVAGISAERIFAIDALEEMTREKEMNIEMVHQSKCSTFNFETNQTPFFPTLSSSLEKVVGVDEFSDNLELKAAEQKIKVEHQECYLEQMKFDGPVRIYSEEEKFQMMSLKNNRKFPEGNLDVSNFCTALIVADTHRNKKLFHSAVEFMSIHKNRLLKSNIWEKFAEKYCELALKILTEVCIKVPEKL